MRLSLKDNFLWMMLGQGVFSSMQWLVMILLAHLGGLVQVGYYSLALAITAPIVTLTRLGLRTVYVTSHTAAHPFGHYFSLRQWSFVPAGAMIGAWAIGSDYETVLALVIVLVGLSKIAEGLSDIAYSLPHSHERLDVIAKSMMLRGIGGTAALGIIYALTAELSLAFAVYAAMWFAVYFLFDRPYVLRRWLTECESAPEPTFPQLWHLVGVSLPMGLAGFFVTMTNSVPRFFVEYFLGPEELGLFAAMAYFIIIGNMMVTSLGQTVRPRLARYFAEGQTTAFWRITLIGTAMAAGMGVTFWLVTLVMGKLVLSVFYGSAFAAHVELFQWVALASIPIFAGGFLGFVLTATGAFTMSLAVNTVAVGAVLAASLTLIPHYGLFGACLTLLVFGGTLLLNVIPLIALIPQRK